MRKFLMTLPSVLVLAGGCAQLAPRGGQSESARIQGQVQDLRIEVQRLEERVDGMATAQDLIQQDLTAIKAASGRKDDKAIQDRLTAIETRLQDAEKEKQALKAEVIDDLTKRMNSLLSAQAPAQAARTESGYEHVVKAGESLSKIAATYKSSVSAIVRANNLKDANSIRAGQKLFIPE